MDQADRVAKDRLLRGAVLAGDERAWRAWYDESFDGLLAFARWRCGGNRELAEEVVQETWLLAVREVRKFVPERGGFAQWLRGLAANVVRNHVRRQRIRDRRASDWNGEPAVESTPAAGLEEHDEWQRIALALAALPERYESVLRAKYLDDATVAEIARQWNESPKAIESLLTRAREAFRQLYRDPSVPLPSGAAAEK